MTPYQKREAYSKFTRDITDLINKNSLENLSDTPDFITGEFIAEIFKSYNKFIKKNNAGAFMVDARNAMESAIDKRRARRKGPKK